MTKLTSRIDGSSPAAASNASGLAVDSRRRSISASRTAAEVAEVDEGREAGHDPRVHEPPDARRGYRVRGEARERAELLEGRASVSDKLAEDDAVGVVDVGGNHR